MCKMAALYILLTKVVLLLATKEYDVMIIKRKKLTFIYFIVIILLTLWSGCGEEKVVKSKREVNLNWAIQEQLYFVVGRFKATNITGYASNLFDDEDVDDLDVEVDIMLKVGKEKRDWLVPHGGTPENYTQVVEIAFDLRGIVTDNVHIYDVGYIYTLHNKDGNGAGCTPINFGTGEDPWVILLSHEFFLTYSLEEQMKGRTIAHELGHIAGLYHIDEDEDSASNNNKRLMIAQLVGLGTAGPIFRGYHGHIRTNDSENGNEKLKFEAVITASEIWYFLCYEL